LCCWGLHLQVAWEATPEQQQLLLFLVLLLLLNLLQLRRPCCV
jgi:hypothetical protein